MSPRKRGVGLKYFYPRPPGGGRRIAIGAELAEKKISIHALRVEGDQRTADRTDRLGYFYPRPPGGGRRGGR